MIIMADQKKVLIMMIMMVMMMMMKMIMMITHCSSPA